MFSQGGDPGLTGSNSGGLGQSIFGSGFNPATLSSGIGGILSGLFGSNRDPYADAMKRMTPFFQQAQGFQNPFYNAGTGAIGNYQNMLQQMSDPSKFMNTLMGNYQQSPWAKTLLQTTQQAGNNAASASGLVGSTPFLQASQQNAQNISSQDMQNWIGQVLGINNQALQGYGNLMNVGQGAANNLSNLFSNYGNAAGQAGYGEAVQHNQNMGNLFGGAASIASMFL